MMTRGFSQYRSCGIIADNVNLPQEATAQGNTRGHRRSLRHRSAMPPPSRFLLPSRGYGEGRLSLPWSDIQELAQGGNLPAHRRIEMIVALLFPVGSGELRLTSRDPHIQPSLDYNYLARPFDRQRLRAGVRQALALAEHGDLKEIIGPRLNPTDADLASDAASDEWLQCEVTIYSHISGTCKMGLDSDAMAVVDQYGKVHGLEGLRVVDASIMPTLMRAPINPTILMIGERIAALMR